MATTKECNICMVSEINDDGVKCNQCKSEICVDCYGKIVPDTRILCKLCPYCRNNDYRFYKQRVLNGRRSRSSIVAEVISNIFEQMRRQQQLSQVPQLSQTNGIIGIVDLTQPELRQIRFNVNIDIGRTYTFSGYVFKRTSKSIIVTLKNRKRLRFKVNVNGTRERKTVIYDSVSQYVIINE